MKLVWFDECFISIAGADGLVLQHQGLSGHNAEYAPMHFQFFNTLRPRQNGRHFAEDIFKRIFLTEIVWIPIKFYLKFVSKGPIVWINDG